MGSFSLKLYSEVTNPKLKFYKLYDDGVSLFDEFIEELETRNKSLKKEFPKILALMDSLGMVNLPVTKFRHINPGHKGDRNDVWEFKSKHLRVYVIRKEPDIFILLGGLKTNQPEDLKNIFRKFNDVPDELVITE